MKNSPLLTLFTLILFTSTSCVRDAYMEAKKAVFEKYVLSHMHSRSYGKTVKFKLYSCWLDMSEVSVYERRDKEVVITERTHAHVRRMFLKSPQLILSQGCDVVFKEKPQPHVKYKYEFFEESKKTKMLEKVNMYTRNGKVIEVNSIERI